MAQKKKKSPAGGRKRRITVSFTWSGLFSTAVLVVLSIIWAFILGILVGRGYSPDSLFPKLAGLLPEAKSRTAQPSSPSGNDQVLKPEELGFFEALQQGGQESGPGGDTPSDEQMAREGAPEQAARNVSRDSAGAVKEGPPGPVYRYIYQVAAFRSAEKAYSLQNRLRSRDIHAEVSEVRIDQREWYRIVVPFEGHAGDTDSLKSELKRLGLHQPLLRSKKRIGSE